MKTRSVVVQERPGQRRLRRLLIAALVVAIFIVGLLIGGFRSLQLSIDTAFENRELRGEILALSRELEQQRQATANLETRREIDDAALVLVRQELASQQETINELERGVRFYKSLMAPGELTEGLSIRSVDIKPGSAAGRYDFRILVQQSARKHQLLTGSLNVDVIGTANGEQVEYNLTELSEQVPSAGIRLRFKYFQAIDGEISLPEGFEPQLLRASAAATKPRRVNVTRDFPWALQEKINHVGQ